MTALDYRYVVHFDMLGMSALTIRDPDLAWAALSKLAIAKEEMLRLGFVIDGSTTLIRERIATFTFSDTILFFSRSDEVEDLQATIILATQLFGRALHYSIPLRGGISHGRFLFNDEYNLFAGPPLVYAYRLGEGAQWLGIVVDDTVAERSSELPGSVDEQPSIIPWEVPLKEGLVTRSVVNWPPIFRENLTLNPPISASQFYQAFRQLFGDFSQLPEPDQRKYVNTVEFMNARLLWRGGS